MCVAQCGERLARRDAAHVGHRQRPVPARVDGPPGGRALRAVRRAAGRERRLRLHGEGVGPRDGDLYPHPAGTHQPSLLLAGRLELHFCIAADVSLFLRDDCRIMRASPVTFQFDGKHIVSGSLDTSIRVWDVDSGNCLHTLIGHQSLTSGMELKNNILVSGNADSTVKVWDITTGQCLQTLQGDLLLRGRRFLRTFPVERHASASISDCNCFLVFCRVKQAPECRHMLTVQQKVRDNLFR